MLDTTFFAAGNATFTIEPSIAFQVTSAAKPHYTYRIRHKPASDGYRETWFVSLLTGPDNEGDYSYIGMYLPKTGEVRLTRGSSLAEESAPVRVLRRVVAAIHRGEGVKVEEAGWAVHHAGKCGRCGRTLTTPESVQRGIGPECIKKM